jgi:tRNA dimethylallyltransferase
MKTSKVSKSRPDPVSIPVILGATGVGKTEIAIQVAQAVGAEIVSADSRQIYRYMDIGTAKPTASQRRKARHWMIDIVEPDVDYSAARYAEEASAAIRKVLRKGRVLLVGGSGLYIQALFEGFFPSPPADRDLRRRLTEQASQLGSEALHARLKRLDPPAAKRIHPHDTKRLIRALEIHELTGIPISQLQSDHKKDPEFVPEYVGLAREKDTLNDRIDARVDQMIQDGFVDEVRKILTMGYPPTLNSLNTLGYREIITHLTCGLPLEEAIQLTKKQTRVYAKRQLSWFRRLRGVSWNDLSEERGSAVVDRVSSLVKRL